MFLSNSCYVLAIVVSSSLFDLSSAADIPRIAGYKPTVDVQDVLEQDLIQKQFQTILKDEGCSDVDAGLDYYENGDGQLLKNLPNYKDSKGAVWNLYEEYYGSPNFCDDWVTKALQGKKYKFKNGSVDFSKFPGNFGDPDDPDGDCVGREECAKKATAYICGYINVHQYLEQAVVTVEGGCVEQLDECTTASEAWDKAVAFFVGSLEGVDGGNVGVPGSGGEYGNQFYALADKRCDDFRTCSASGDTANRGTPSKANILMIGLFQQGASAIYAGDVDNARAIIKKINTEATVPFIQGTLRYAWRLGQAKGDKSKVKDKEVAEGGTFLAGALPQLWKCDKKAAKIVLKELQIGGNKVKKGKTKFKKVLDAFECNYECLGITCAQIGALYDGDEFDAEDPDLEFGTEPRSPQCTDPRTDLCTALDNQTIKKCKKYTSNENKGVFGV